MSYHYHLAFVHRLVYFDYGHYHLMVICLRILQLFPYRHLRDVCAHVPKKKIRRTEIS